MAKGNRAYNKNARQKKTVSIDDSATKQIVVDDAEILKGKYDESNALALPSKKRKVKTTSVEGGGRGPGKLLSRKQKLRLEAIVARREKKRGRAEILSELQKHQLPAHTLDALTPLVKVQTEGTRRSTANAILQTLAGIEGRKQQNDEQQLSAGSKQKPLRFRSWSRRFISSLNQKEVKKNPKVLGFEEEEDSSSSEDSVMSEGENDADVKIEEPIPEAEKEDNEDEEEVMESFVDEVDISEADVTAVKSEEPEKLQSKPSGSPDRKAASKPKVIVKPKPKAFVTVDRKKEIQDKRNKLPILAEEQVIMESITDNAVTVVAGETGSGKTTQIPQFLYEAGYTLQGRMIGITEPRRVAAISMSHRVGVELNLSSKEVSYQIRYEGNTSKSTKIKFMTDGVLLKEMEKDFLLSNYSAICIDEAHERSLYTDILIGLLSRCVLVRAKRKDPLKLIIMSATLRIEDFVENSRLFKTRPTLIHVPARQFSVQIHFSRITPQNYVLAAFKKVLQIHRKLPQGGILVFVTGQQEVRTLVKQLSGLYNKRVTDTGRKKANASKHRNTADKRSSLSKPDLRTFDLSKLDASAPLASAEGEDDLLDGSDDDDEMLSSTAGGWDVNDDEIPETPLHILPLYSMLPTSEQQKIFESPPEGTRLCVISTNVAETSLTIPSIRYVVDCGKVKQKVWDKLTGVQQFSVQWESKASAEQRAGRAGRVGPGHCYRLFSSAVFDSEFDKYSTPEIQVRPVDDMMLLMKSMSIERVSNFPFPSHPGDVQLKNAENILKALGALEESSAEKVPSTSPATSSLAISELGKTMARFPLGPRFAKMLALSFSTHLVSFVIALVSALSVQEIFIESAWEANSSDHRKKWKAIKRQWAGSGSSFLLGDAMVALKAVGAFEYSGGTEEFCLRSGLRHKAMMEIRKLRKQLTTEVNSLATSRDEEIPLDPQMKPPSDEDTILLRQLLLSGLPDRIARKAQDSGDGNSLDKDFKHAYRCGELEDLVYIHNGSVLYDNDPDWIVYQEVFESTGKLYLRGVTAIEPQWIPVFCESLCRLEQILTQPPPFYDTQGGLVKCHQKVSYGRQGWELPIAQTEYPLRLQKFKLFAQFLLEGQVFPVMKRWTQHLLSLPVTMTKPWAKLQPRTQSFLKVLTDNGIHKKEHLLKKWTGTERTFLLGEYLEWVPEEFHCKVKTSWPPLDQE